MISDDSSPDDDSSAGPSGKVLAKLHHILYTKPGLGSAENPFEIGDSDDEAQEQLRQVRF